MKAESAVNTSKILNYVRNAWHNWLRCVKALGTPEALQAVARARTINISGSRRTFQKTVHLLELVSTTPTTQRALQRFRVAGQSLLFLLVYQKRKVRLK